MAHDMSQLAHVVIILYVLDCFSFIFFFFNDTATTEIYTLSLHDALPISRWKSPPSPATSPARSSLTKTWRRPSRWRTTRSEEHTSELQSPCNLVCRLLLEKKKRPRGAFHLA